MDISYYFYISEYDRKMYNVARLHENVEEYSTHPCHGCPFYDEWAGMVCSGSDEEKKYALEHKDRFSKKHLACILSMGDESRKY